MIRTYLQKASLLVMAVALVGVLVPLNTSAQQEDKERLTLSPVDKRYDIDAGDTIEDSVQVINNGDTDYNFLVYARPYSVNNEAYEPNFEEVTARGDAYQWIQFDKTDFNLKAGEEATVNYTMRVPKDAAPGGHYGVIFAEIQPKDEGTGNVIARKKRAGTILYATVKGDIIQQGELLETSIPFWQQKPPLSVTSRVENSGNVDFTVTSGLKIQNIFGNTVHEHQYTHPVLPDTTRAIALDWRESPRLGLYKVTLDTHFLETRQSTSNYVLLMPAWLPILFAIVLIAGVAYVVARRLRK